jgi:hypothetical protein
MALSYEQFMKASGAELVAGNIIVGIMGDRKKVGTLGDDGVFNLNDEGKELAEDLEATPAERAARKKKSDVDVDVAAEAAAAAAE